MKKSSSLVLCATAVSAVAVISACKPSQPAQPAAQPTPSVAPSVAPTAPTTPVATPAATEAPAAAASPAATEAADGLALKDPVATVNGEPITKAQLEEAFNNAVQASGVKVADLTDEQKLEGYRQLLDELIVDKLVSKAAAEVVVSQEEVDAEIAKIKKQFPNEEEFNKQLTQAGQSPDKLQETLKKMLQQQRWIESQIGDKGKVTSEEAKAFYDKNQAEFQEGASVKASHILFLVKPEDSPEVTKAKLEAAKKAIARAKKEDFTTLAKELSEEPGAKESGGDLGFFTKDRMVPEFADAAFTQKVGTVSTEPVKTQFGYHVIKVTDTKPARTVPFTEVEPQVTNYLKSDKQRKAVQEVLAGLRSSAKIDDTLPAPAPQAPASLVAPVPAEASTPAETAPAPAPANP